MTLTYKAQNGQSLFDICLMTYGALDNLVKLVQDSLISSVSEEEVAGKNFVFESELISDVSFANAIKSNKKVFATAETPETGGSYDDSFDLSFD